MFLGLSKTSAPMFLVARLLPGLKTLLHTLSLRAAVGDGVVGVSGPTGLAGIDNDLWYLLDPSPVPESSRKNNTANQILKTKTRTEPNNPLASLNSEIKPLDYNIFEMHA